MVLLTFPSNGMKNFFASKLYIHLINLAGQESQMANKIRITKVLLLLTDDLEVGLTVRIALHNSSLAHPLVTSVSHLLMKFDISSRTLISHSSGYIG